MVFEGGPHSFGLLRWGVGLLVPVQVVGVVLVTAWEGREREHNGQLTVQKIGINGVMIKQIKCVKV